MSGWLDKGCAVCRQGVLSGRYPPPTCIGIIAEGWAFLYRCEACGSYWIFNLREAHIISAAEARDLCPAPFPTGD
jgi:hypothetical protein